jgi:hypothetical protein
VPLLTGWLSSHYVEDFALLPASAKTSAWLAYFRRGKVTVAIARCLKLTTHPVILGMIQLRFQSTRKVDAWPGLMDPLVFQEGVLNQSYVEHAEFVFRYWSIVIPLALIRNDMPEFTFGSQNSPYLRATALAR